MVVVEFEPLQEVFTQPHRQILKDGLAMIVRIKDRYFQLLCLAGDVMNILNMAAA